jgi:Uncharacterized conserved protein
MKNELEIMRNSHFKEWIIDIKKRIKASQIKAAVQVNSEMLHLYWDIGKDIERNKLEAKWGSNFYESASKALKLEIPELRGLSVTNLKYMRRFYAFYSAGIENRQQVVDDLKGLFSIPWGHQIMLITKCNDIEEAMFYVSKTLSNGWSRNMLLNFLDANLYETQGKAITNFSELLPEAQSDLAKETLKDPYNFDFLTLTEGYKEKELEDALVSNITNFLIELGQGFAFVGRQVPLRVGEKEVFIDLLFYHLKLSCYVVVELKVCEFDAAFTGQLGLYVAAVNHQKKKDTDNTTLGLLICKTKDSVMAEYSLESSSQPIGISEYDLSNVLPKSYESTLPSIEDIEESVKKLEQ